MTASPEFASLLPERRPTSGSPTVRDPLRVPPDGRAGPALPLPRVGRAGCPAGPAAPRRQPVGPLVGPGEPASGRPLPRVRPRPAGPRRLGVEPGRRLLGRRPRPSDALAFIEDQGLATRSSSGTRWAGMVAMRWPCRRGRTGGAWSSSTSGPELSPKGVEVVPNFVVQQRRVRRPGRVPRQRGQVRPVPFPGAHRPDGQVQHAAAGRRQVRQQGRPPARSASASAPRVGPRRLSGLAGPVLLVRGGESDVLEPDAAERFVAALPDGRLVTVPGAGHNVHSANTPGVPRGRRPLPRRPGLAWASGPQGTSVETPTLESRIVST